MFCKNCGKEIEDSAVVCPSCGVPTDNFNIKDVVGEGAKDTKVNAFGIAGFVVSILSLWIGMFFCIASVVGLVLSIVGMTKRNKCNSCNALALAGFIVGIISIAIWGLVWLIYGTTILF